MDVNVHPTKLEVKFSDDKKIFDAVYCAVRNALENSVRRPQMKIEPSSVSYDDIKLKNAFVPIYDRAETVLSQKPEQKLFFEEEGEKEPTPPVETKIQIVESDPEPVAEQKPEERIELPFVMTEPEPMPEPETVIPTEPVSAVIPTVQQEPEVMEIKHTETPVHRKVEESKIPYYKIIGEAFNSYVMVELEDKMLMIDKHAAHERIIFENMKRNMQKGECSQQMLMFPINVILTPEEYAAVCEHENEIRAIGFEYTADGYILSVAGIPADLTEEAAKELLEVLARQLALGIGKTEVTRNSFMERALYQASCKAAIKAGRIEDQGHIKWICDNLLALPDIKFCPHGRPVAIELTKKEMERSFKRT